MASNPALTQTQREAANTRLTLHHLTAKTQELLRKPWDKAKELQLFRTNYAEQTARLRREVNASIVATEPQFVPGIGWVDTTTVEPTAALRKYVAHLGGELFTRDDGHVVLRVDHTNLAYDRDGDVHAVGPAPDGQGMLVTSDTLERLVAESTVTTSVLAPEESEEWALDSMPVTAFDFATDPIVFWAGIIAGLALGVLFCAWFDAQPYLSVPCPSANGRVCNGHGTCQFTGFCACEPLFSGTSCSTSACLLAYNGPADNYVGGLGVCSPTLTQRPDACADVTPSPENGFAARGPGWGDPGCISLVQNTLAALAAIPFPTPADLAALNMTLIPQLFCSGELAGDMCQYSVCPRDSEYNVCGGHGNTSVSYFSNASAPNGNGCYCRAPFSFFDDYVAGQLSDAALATLRQPSTLSFFQQPFCGTIVFLEDTFVIIKGAVTLDSDTDTACACQAKFYGAACENGACPAASPTAPACSGSGNPNFGFGLLTNTTLATNDGVACNPICASDALGVPTVPCTGAVGATGLPCAPNSRPDLFEPTHWCQVQEVCPPSAQWRCNTNNGGCVTNATATRFCAQNYGWATLDPAYWESVRQPCDMSQAADAARCIDFNASATVASFVPGTGTTARAFSTTTPRPPVWFYFSALVLSSPTTISLAFQGASFAYSGAAGERVRAAAVLQVPEPTLALAAYANTSATRVTARQLNSDTFPGRIALSGNFPFLNTLPSGWGSIRLASNADATLVRAVVDAGALGAELAVFTLNEAFAAVAASTDLTEFVGPGGALQSLQTCLATPSLCAWPVVANTSISATLGGPELWACPVGAGGNTTWTASSTPCFVSVNAASNVFGLHAVLTVRNRVGLTSATAFALNAWTVQLPAVPSYTLAFSASAPVSLEEFDVLTADDVQQPCLCEPPTGRQIMNRTMQDAIWGNDATRAAAAFAAGAYAVVPFAWAGSPYWRRGIVALGDAISTTVAVRGFGLISSATNAVRSLSVAEMISGIDDAPLDVYAARCPTGYASDVAVADFNVSTACSCLFSAATTTNGVNCACNDTAAAFTCACALGASYCECGIPDRDFETRLQSLLLAANASCLCFASDNRAFPALTAAVFVNGTNDAAWLVEGGVDRPLLGLLGVPCVPVVSIQAFDDRFGDYNVSVPFEATCSEDGSNTLELRTLEGPWQYTSYLVQLADPLTSLEAVWSPGGVPVDELVGVTYSASSTATGSAPGNARAFSGAWWTSAQPAWLAPVSLQVAFAQPAALARVFVHVRSAAIALASGAALPVQLRVFALNASGSFLVANWTSWATPAAQDARVITLPVAGLYSGVQLQSDFALQVAQLVPLADQACACNQSVFLVNPAQLDTQTLWERVQLYDATYDPSQGPCVCVDSCFATIGGTPTGNLANNGRCDDLPGVMFELNASLVDVAQTTSQTYTAAQLYATVLGNPSASPVAFSLFAGASFGFPSAQIVVYWLVTGSGSAPVNADAAAIWANIIAAGNTTFPYNYSAFVYYPLSVTTPPVLLANTNAQFSTSTGSATVTTTNVVPTYVPSTFDPAAACAAGYDCSDCGLRPSFNESATPGAVCDLGLAATLIEDAAVPPGEWRAVWEFGSYLLPFVTLERRVLTPESACAEQVCPAPTARCVDGSCSATACAPLFNCPGDGCTPTNENAQDYSCVCAQNGGLYCQITATVPASPYDFNQDPYSIATCNGKGPIMEQLPSDPDTPLLPITDAWLLQHNRLWNPRLVPTTTRLPSGVSQTTYLDLTVGSDPRAQPDVRNIRVQGRHGACGYLRMRTMHIAGDPPATMIMTNCMPARVGPFGDVNYLEDDVQTRSDAYPYVVTQWVCHPLPGGGCQTYPWANETHYYDAMVRGANGGCYPTAQAAAVASAINPMCGGNGVCLPSGACQCNPGTESFFVTAILTAEAAPTDASDPCNFGVPETNNWRDFAQTCNYRDCTVVDCSAPVGCFPGTPALSFADAWVRCPNPARNNPAGGFATVGPFASNAGQCAPTLADCNTGNVEPPQLCSGNGIAYQRDWRAGDWACHCGTPRSISADISAIQDPSQLISNGWGGDSCSIYYCSQTGLYFATFDPETGLPYQDLGVNVPGRWLGYCGAFIGPDPDDANEWAACCSELRPERCASVPCIKSGVISCVAPAQCIPSGGTPLVYPANNHGTALRDGTVACTQDQQQGTFYASDLTRFSRANCYAQAQCPLSALNGQVCAYVAGCTDPTVWIAPPADRSFNDQIDAQMLVQGDEVSNYTVALYMTQISQRLAFRKTALVDLAEETQSAIDDAATCICVYPDDNPADPFAMVAYNTPAAIAEVGPYGKAFSSPYQLPVVDAVPSNGAQEVLSLLTDEYWSSYALGGAPTTQVLTLQANDSLLVRFDQAYSMSLVRMHASWSCAAGSSPESNTAAGPYLTFRNEQGEQLCADFAFPASTCGTWDWAGSGAVITCLPAYAPLDFQATYPQAYQANCANSFSAAACVTWRQIECADNGGVFVQPGALDVYVGCTVALTVPAPTLAPGCCVLTGPPIGAPSDHVIVTASPAGSAVTMDELRVLGYGAAVQPIPPALQQQNVIVGGSGTAACAAAPDLLFGQVVFGLVDQGYYFPGDGGTTASCTQTTGLGTLGPCGFVSAQSPRTFVNARAFCESTGGWLATTVQPLLTNANTETNIATALAAQNAPTSAYHVAASVWIDMQDVAQGPVVETNDYVVSSCQQWGCYEPGIAGVPGVSSTPANFYAAPNPSVYDSAWFNGNLETTTAYVQGEVLIASSLPVQQVAWTSLFDLLGNGGIDNCDSPSGGTCSSPPNTILCAADIYNTTAACNTDCVLIGQQACPASCKGKCAAFMRITVLIEDGTILSTVENGRATGMGQDYFTQGGSVDLCLTASSSSCPAAPYVQATFPVFGYDFTELVTWRDGSSLRTNVPVAMAFTGENCGVLTCAFTSSVGTGENNVDGTEYGSPCLVPNGQPPNVYTGYSYGPYSTPGDFWIYPTAPLEGTLGTYRLNGYGSETPPTSISATLDAFSIQTAEFYSWSGVYDGAIIAPDSALPTCITLNDEGIVTWARSIRFYSMIDWGQFTFTPGTVPYDVAYSQDQDQPNPRSLNMGYLSHLYMAQTFKVQFSLFVVGVGSAGPVNTYPDASWPYVLSPQTLDNINLGLDGSSGGPYVLVEQQTSEYTLYYQDDYLTGYSSYPATITPMRYALVAADGTSAVTFGAAPFSMAYTGPTRSIIQCSGCLPEQNPDWRWDSHVQMGGPYPDAVNDLSCQGQGQGLLLLDLLHPSSKSPTQSPGVSGQYILGPANSGFGTTMAFDPDGILYYTHESCSIQASGYDVTWGRLGCRTQTLTGCGGVSSSFGQDWCGNAHNFACIYDWTKYVAQSGRRGDVCGPDDRVGGTPQPGLTCFAAFPLANATLNPAGYAALDAYNAGTLDVIVQTSGGDYNALRTFLETDLGAWWALPDAYAKWAAGYSNQPGQVSRGVLANPVAWVDYNLLSIWPIDCGPQVNVATGLITRRCASQQAYCNPNAAQRAPIAYTESQLSTGLGPVGPGVNPFFSTACGQPVKPALYYTADDNGLPPPGYELSINVIASSATTPPNALVFGALRTTLSVYNTQKDVTGYVFSAGLATTVAGYVQLDCAACAGSPARVTTWIAPLDPYGRYPSQTIVLGVQLLEASLGAVAYEYNVTVSADEASNATYQTVGWDFANLAIGAIVTVQEAVITNAASLAACNTFRAQMPKFGPLSSVDSGAPFHQCISSAQDELYYGLQQAQCLCDVNRAGAACDCPAILTRFGKLCLGGWGDGGANAIGTDGNVYVTSTGDEAGLFIQTIGGVNTPMGKCRDVGRILRTRLTQSRDYPVVYVYDNTYGGAQYVAAPMSGATLTEAGQFLEPYVLAQDDAETAAGTLASFVDYDEFAAYNEALPPNAAPAYAPATAGSIAPSACPAGVTSAVAATWPNVSEITCPGAFLSLVKNDPAVVGNADVVWPDRGYPFYPSDGSDCASAATCGFALSYPVDCGGWTTLSPTSDSTAPPAPPPQRWPAAACAAVNFNNLAFGNAWVTITGSPALSPVAALNDGSATFGSGLSVASGDAITITIPAGAAGTSQDFTIYVFGSAFPTFPGSCASVSGQVAPSKLAVFQCPGGFAYVLTEWSESESGTVDEIQVFAASDSRRTGVYAYF